MTNKERAIAWMKQECAAADGPRFSALGEPDVPGEPHCDCVESLATLLDNVRAEALESAAKECQYYANCGQPGLGNHAQGEIYAAVALMTRIRALKSRAMACAGEPTSRAECGKRWSGGICRLPSEHAGICQD